MFLSYLNYIPLRRWINTLEIHVWLLFLNIYRRDIILRIINSTVNPCACSANTNVRLTARMQTPIFSPAKIIYWHLIMAAIYNLSLTNLVLHQFRLGTNLQQRVDRLTLLLWTRRRDSQTEALSGVVCSQRGSYPAGPQHRHFLFLSLLFSPTTFLSEILPDFFFSFPKKYDGYACPIKFYLRNASSIFHSLLLSTKIRWKSQIIIEESKNEVCYQNTMKNLSKTLLNRVTYIYWVQLIRN